MLVHFAVKLTGVPAAVAYKKSYTAVGREPHVDVGFHTFEIAAYKQVGSKRTRVGKLSRKGVEVEKPVVAYRTAAIYGNVDFVVNSFYGLPEGDAGRFVEHYSH